MFAIYLDKLLFAYVLALLAFLLIRLFSKLVRERTAGFLNVANLIALLLVTINLIEELFKAMQCLQIKHELNSSLEAGSGAIDGNRNCFTVLILTFILGFAFQLLFLRNRNRVNLWITIFSMTLLTLYIKLEFLIILVTQLFRDYIPSEWTVTYNGPEKWLQPAFACAFFLACWIISGLKPHRRLST